MRALTVPSLINMIEDLVAGQSDLRAVAACGSWVRGNPRPDSDLNLLILANEPERWRREQGWVSELPYSDAGLSYLLHEIASYGDVWLAYISLEPDAKLELTFAPLSWADVDPVDPDRRFVVADAFSIILDKDGSLSRLTAACLRPRVSSLR